MIVSFKLLTVNAIMTSSLLHLLFLICVISFCHSCTKNVTCVVTSDPPQKKNKNYIINMNCKFENIMQTCEYLAYRNKFYEKNKEYVFCEHKPICY